MVISPRTSSVRVVSWACICIRSGRGASGGGTSFLTGRRSSSIPIFPGQMEIYNYVVGGRTFSDPQRSRQLLTVKFRQQKTGRIIIRKNFSSNLLCRQEWTSLNKYPPLLTALHHLSIEDQGEKESNLEKEQRSFGNHGGICVICLDKIALQEIALVKGCEHAYCVTCILQWATYSKNPTCPQCKHRFEFLNVHRSLDGSIHDYMFEESVCLLLRASWFKPLTVEEQANAYSEIEDFDFFEEEYLEDDLDEVYYRSSSSSIRIGNRRWGDNGYVRGGRQEARPRPVYQSNFQDSGAGSSSQSAQKEAAKSKTGRRAKRTLKREAADRAAAAKHESHLARLGRK
ncbi:uncharacterized protein LOC21385087 [Morus notabilis]|uniref:uncharacterized protein LOC21385087 n=1 Tax=Morus notabilis TaxID=981085 RepID=UPI000CECFF0C|nr:uncharacterized protein LOC21385087 [Morus notabilis]